MREFFDDTPYVVPAYQRDYAWSAGDQVADLLVDLGDFIDGDEPYYLLGQVIVCPTENGGYELVDGQQRVTSLMLLLIWIRTKFENLRRDGAFTDSSESVMDTNHSVKLTIKRNTPGGAKPLRLLDLTANGGAALLEHLEANGTTDGFEAVNSTQEHMCEAWNEIENRYGNKWLEIEDFARAINKLLEQVYLVRLVVDSPQKAFSIFERINNRGLDLSGSDLLKNLLFQKLEADDYASITENWDMATKTLFGATGRRLQSSGYLLRSLAQERAEGVVINNTSMYKFWTENLDSRERTHELLKELGPAAKSLVNLSQKKTPNGDECQWLAVPAHFAFVQHFPILLASRHLQPEAQMRLARLVQDRVILSLLTEERPQAFEALAARWAVNIKNLPVGATIKDIDAIAKDGRIYDPTLRSKMLTVVDDLRYDSARDRKRLRMILALASHQMEVACKESDLYSIAALLQGSKRASKGFDLDHVWPQNLKNSALDKHKHRLGNLVLVFALDQRVVKNKKPADKIEIYIASKLNLTSMLARNNSTPSLSRISTEVDALSKHGIVELKTWDIAAIETRKKQYLDLFDRYLALPNL
jgi:hypothetical protein